jgi:OOP family OmpA-OmpF porin
MSMKIHAVLAALLLHFSLPALAQPQPDEAGKLIAAGTVPDEAARAAILGKLRELYGAANVVDRLEVGGVVPPPTGPTT